MDSYETIKVTVLDMAREDSRNIFFVISCQLKGMDIDPIRETLHEWYAHREAIVTDPYL